MGDVSSRKIILCLSGGGLRATFFHLGTIRALRETDLIRNVSKVYSVSGGSILAAHMNLNWQQYCGSEEDFSSISLEIEKFGQRDVRGRVVRRWILSWIMFLPLPILRFIPYFSNRSLILERQYQSLYKNKDIPSLSSEDGAPEIRILSTSFVRGALGGFSSEGYVKFQENETKLFKTDTISIAKAVTASSAFPALFPPVKLEREQINASIEEFPFSPDYLSDGGVFDNLGIDAVIENNDLETDPNSLVIISDASAPFDWKTTSNFSLIISSALRASDILMKRVAEILLDKTRSEIKKDSIVHISIADETDTDQTSLPIGVVSRLPKTRTDLDKFSLEEQNFLMEHGYYAARRKLSSFFPETQSPASQPTKLDIDSRKAVDIAEYSAIRKLRFLSFSDWASHLAITWLFVLTFFIYVGIDRYSDQFKEKVTEDVSNDYAKENKKNFEDLKDPSNQVAPPTEVDKRKIPIFIQFAGYKRDVIKTLAKELVENGWNVQGAAVGGERIASAENKAEVRYGNKKFQKVAENLAQDIQSRLDMEIKANYNSEVIDDFEVWVGLK